MNYYYRIDLAYDGGNYYGFQKQIKHITIQAVIDKALKKIFQQEIKTVSSGRTDSKVHAYAQVISFKANVAVPAAKLKFALNNLMPADIVILAAAEVSEEFHARYSAVAKCYTYKIAHLAEQSPFRSRYVWQIPQELDLTAMQVAAKYIIGEHDFSSFRSAGSVQSNPVRKMYAIDWDEQPEELVFKIIGNGFLYHMVRNIVGALVQVGQRKFTVEHFREILELKSRAHKGLTAPAQGLYLQQVFYSEEAVNAYIDKYFTKNSKKA